MTYKQAFSAAVAALTLCAFFASGCSKETGTASLPTPVVNAITVVQQDLPWDIEYPAQVAGSLEIHDPLRHPARADPLAHGGAIS